MGLASLEKGKWGEALGDEVTEDGGHVHTEGCVNLAQEQALHLIGKWKIMGVVNRGVIGSNLGFRKINMQRHGQEADKGSKSRGNCHITQV